MPSIKYVHKIIRAFLQWPRTFRLEDDHGTGIAIRSIARRSVNAFGGPDFMHSNPWPQADQPITSVHGDLLEREEFALRVAEIIGEVQSIEASSVLALVGPWGCGKSSLIHMIGAMILNISGGKPGHSWQVRQANMWAPPDTAALLKDLFTTIRDAIPRRGPTRRLHGLLREYAALAIPALSLVPVAGNAAQGIASNIVSHRAQRPMQTVFQELSDQLRRANLQILVVLDDVDRLQPDELLMLFKAIRLVARFPGVYYLLAYDEQTIVDVLMSTPVAQGSRERALAYLEKIVQVRLDVPPAQRFHTERMLAAGIDGILETSDMLMSEEQQSRFRELYETLLQHSLSQPRAVGRFLRQAAAYLPAAEDGELDVVDFLALTHLRSLSPGTYRLLARSKSSLTVHPGGNCHASAEFQEQVRASANAECGELGDQVFSALGQLFPLDDEYWLRPGAPDWRQLAFARRASVEEYFDRYFVFSLPAGDIADRTAGEMLAAIARPDNEEADVPTFTEIDGILDFFAAEKQIKESDPSTAARIIRKLIRMSSTADAIQDGDPIKLLRYALLLPSKVSWPSDLLLDSPRQLSVSWAAELIPLVIRAEPSRDRSAAAVDADFETPHEKQLAHQLIVELDDGAFSRLCEAIKQAASTPTPSARELRPLYGEIQRTAASRVLDHLRQRDSASLLFPFRHLVRFLNQADKQDGLTHEIGSALDDGTFTLADLASRFVIVTQEENGGDQITGFDGDALISLMGLSVLRDLYGARKDKSALPTDEADTTWPGRARAGLASLSRVIQDKWDIPPQVPSGVHAITGDSPLTQTGPRQWASPAEFLSSGTDDSLLCVRAAVLLPGTAIGLPNDLASDMTNSEEGRARVLAGILGQVPLTRWSLRTASQAGLELQQTWTESASSRIIANFSLKTTETGEQPLTAHCATAIGSAETESPAPETEDALCLVLDLLLRLPFPAPREPEPSVDGIPILGGSRISIFQLTKIAELMTQSAIQAARNSAAQLLGLHPIDGHMAIWLETSEPLDAIFDLDTFNAVDGQRAPGQASVFANLPLEPGQEYDTAGFTDSVRGVAVELVHELLRSSGRRSYLPDLHRLRDARPYP